MHIIDVREMAPCKAGYYQDSYTIYSNLAPAEIANRMFDGCPDQPMCNDPRCVICYAEPTQSDLMHKMPELTCAE